jgi:hypothetical protein
MKTRLFVLSLFMLSALLCAEAFAGFELTEIDVTADMKRVAIKFTGKAPAFHDVMISGPTRLVIDVPDVGVTSPSISGIPADCGLAVRTARTRTGGRVVLDFGRVQAPQYKIRPMDNYLLVFLGDWLPEPSNDNSAGKPEAAAPDKALVPAEPIITAGGPSGVIIKSAKTVNDTIVLHVANPANPGALYKIDLKVDFESLGFSAAQVALLKSQKGAPASLSKKPAGLVHGVRTASFLNKQ